MQDQVANHVGPYHPWVADPPGAAWFNGTADKHLDNTWQTWTLMDPYSQRATRRETLEGWFINLLPDMNQSDLDVRRYEIQNALWWVGMTGVDAIRQDTMPYVPREFWREWSMALRREFPRVRTVGEVFDADPAFTSFYQGGRRGHDGIDTGYDSVFDFPLYFALRSAFARNGDLREVPRALAHDFLYPNPSMLVTFLGLHDVERFMSEPGATSATLRMAYTALFTLRGVPMVYYGDEIGMRGGKDPDNRRDFPGGWAHDAHNAFTQEGRTPEEDETFRHVQSLARIRRASPALREGKMINLYATEKQWVYAREISQSQAVVAYNTSGAPAEIAVEAAAAHLKNGARLIDLLDKSYETTAEGGVIKLSLAARRSRILVPAQQQ
jgi:glycosidase